MCLWVCVCFALTKLNWALMCVWGCETGGYELVCMCVSICHHFQEYFLTTVLSDTAVGVFIYSMCVSLCVCVCEIDFFKKKQPVIKKWAVYVCARVCAVVKVCECVRLDSGVRSSVWTRARREEREREREREREWRTVFLRVQQSLVAVEGEKRNHYKPGCFSSSFSLKPKPELAALVSFWVMTLI